MPKGKEIVKRLAPSHGFMLVAEQMGGGKFQQGFRLCFDFAAYARIKEATGLELWKDLPQWGELGSSNVLPEVLHAAILRHHPEYEGKEGLDAVRSYIDASNAGQVADALFEAYLITLPADVAKSIREVMEKIKSGEHKADPADPTGQAPEAPANA